MKFQIMQISSTLLAGEFFFWKKIGIFGFDVKVGVPVADFWVTRVAAGG